MSSKFFVYFILEHDSVDIGFELCIFRCATIVSKDRKGFASI